MRSKDRVAAEIAAQSNALTREQIDNYLRVLKDFVLPVAKMLDADRVLWGEKKGGDDAG